MTSGRPLCAEAPASIAQAISPDVEAQILALNNAHAIELSLLQPARLSTLVDGAFYARRIGAAEAFLLAFDQDADYDSPNYLWFRERLARFVYIDRIAVAAEARGRGYARQLYADLIARAEAAGHDQVVCEVNAQPPNPASDAFHAALGFVAVGRAEIHGGSKTVRYLTLAIHPAGPEVTP
ncbi:MAG TPA: GNAT family N-acetyltransferase [Aliidongia sp.]|uniref:GNAT family N-acetyltransferase n=1 Tax=Aliidongia sp. TaxID=1914230 RepID=UPI002DDDB4B6|nr:GNAT family N-acetyltransferase [Aliidongia sp.]HEV2678070.1 GNAT family N-acetyltransferase [Aliidongia sp.]